MMTRLPTLRTKKEGCGRAAFSFVICVGSVQCIFDSARGDAIHDVVARASPAVVKLYGAAAGREHGYGTGVLVSADGKVMTALSLLVTGSELRVVTADGRRFDGKLIRMDEARQLALIQVDAENLPYMTPTPADDLQIGETILALSNYFKIADGDESASVCRGVLTAKLASLHARRLTQGFEYTGPAIVYDAITSNPGAAGGPVLDLQGRFIGMIGKTVEAAATNTRLNYAVPAEVLADFLADKSKSGGPAKAGGPSPAGARPYIGLKLSELGFHHVAAYVERVRPDSPAAKAGLKPDDLIVAIDAQRIGDSADFQKAIEGLMPGQTVQFTVKRGPNVLTVPVTVGVHP